MLLLDHIVRRVGIALGYSCCSCPSQPHAFLELALPSSAVWLCTGFILLVSVWRAEWKVENVLVCTSDQTAHGKGWPFSYSKGI